MATKEAPNLFEQCRIFIVCSQDVSRETAEQLAALVEEYGGEPSIHESSPEQTSLIECTHIVSSTINFQSYDYFSNALVPVVKPAWVHTSILKRKLANPRQYNPDPRLFLNNVVVTCGDIPEGDKDAIIGGVLAKGGLYSPKVSGMVTHLVDLTADSDKARLVKSKATHIKIVLPHWFDDCLKLGQRIDEKPYILPDPEILRAGPNDPIRWNENKDVAGASTPAPREMNFSTTTKELKVFEGKCVMMSEDLEIGQHLRQSIEAVLEKSGATVTSQVEEADWVVCKFRKGVVYRIASRLDKVVGNLAWLYYLMTFNTYTRPLSRPLHYPVSPEPIPGFQGLRISLSNYVGEARIYLENLIAASGAECTKTLRQDNTHLITAHGTSEKCNAAREWGLQVVNHLWLEDSYAKWKEQPVSDPRYSHFPSRTNLSDIVGQKMLDPAVLKQVFYSTDEEHAVRPMQIKDQNAPTQSPDEDPQEDEKDEPEAAHTTPQAAGKSSRRAPHQTPARSRLIPENKENETPSSTSSRKSKDAATARLHGYAPDLALYEKERKRVGGVIYGGRRVSDEDRIKLTSNPKKRRSAEPQDESDSEQVTDTKRQKKSRPPISMRLLVTGYQKWVGKGNDKKIDTDKRHLRDLGIMLVQDAGKCTHLAAPTILRTTKFVNALAYAPVILSTEFVTDCLQQDQLLDPKDYPLVDKTNEKKFGISLSKAAGNAKKNKNKLLKGYRIYCVDDIRGGFDAFKSIVDANGGECLLFRGRLALANNSRNEESDDDESETEQGDEPAQNEVFLLSSVEPKHARLWPRFRQVAGDIKKTPRIVRVDWLLDMAMSQELRVAGDYEVTEDMIQDADD